MKRRRRQAGSVRFDPYYKVQYWVPRSQAWRDVQRSFAAEADAEVWAATRYRAGEWRLMYVTEAGRRPV